MSTLFQTVYFNSGRRFRLGSALAISLLFSIAVAAQSTAATQVPAATPTAVQDRSGEPQPVATIYHEVKIGTAADDVKHLLGKPNIDEEDGFFYEQCSEILQIRLVADKKVRLLSVTYTGDISKAPKYADVFVNDPMDAKPDGSVYRLVRYPAAGYWVSYSRTAGDKPSVTVTMQKL